MQRKIDWLAKRDTLRATAEALLPDFGKVFPDKSPTEILMNELLIHKVELEVQIDELKRANLAMEESRDRYLDLYDRSPVGFITVNRDGLMTELNLRASDLLGIDRFNMLQDRFTNHVAMHDMDKWNLSFLRLMEQNTAGSESLTLDLLDAAQKSYLTQVYCQRVKTADQISMLRLTLISDNKTILND